MVQWIIHIHLVVQPSFFSVYSLTYKFSEFLHSRVLIKPSLQLATLPCSEIQEEVKGEEGVESCNLLVLAQSFWGPVCILKHLGAPPQVN